MLTVSGTWGEDMDVLETITTTRHTNRSLNVQFSILSCCPRRFCVGDPAHLTDNCTQLGSNSDHLSSRTWCLQRNGRFVSSNSPGPNSNFEVLHIIQREGGACAGEPFELKICIYSNGTGSTCTSTNQPIDIV